MSQKVALITGITGQDGSYLAELLLKKGYQVNGLKRWSSSFNSGRIDHLIKEWYEKSDFRLYYGDLTDSSSLFHIIQKVKPDEIYNLAAQSHVKVSFDEPEYTANSDGLGVLRILEVIRTLGLEKKTRFYQASTSELYGSVREVPQKETTPFYPRSPYGVAKLYGYWITLNYREAYNLYACNGILFNHESPRRGEIFVTRKVTMAATNIIKGNKKKLVLGNLNSLRDWGHARDYVEAMWLMLQQDKPKDYVIATGMMTSIRDFVKMTFAKLGVTLSFEGEGVNEKGIVTKVEDAELIKKKASEIKVKPGDVLVEVHEKYFRPAEVDELLGDASLARKELGWQPKCTLEELVEEMVLSDYSNRRHT